MKGYSGLMCDRSPAQEKTTTKKQHKDQKRICDHDKFIHLGVIWDML